MKHLYRSHANKVLGGVCGGLGHYFNIDPVLIRLVWLLLIFFGGIGLVLYLIAWIIIPVVPEAEVADAGAGAEAGLGKGRFWWGLALVLMGVVLWGGHQFRPFYWPLIPGVRLQSRDFVPVALLLVGVYLLYTFGRASSGVAAGRETRLYRSRDDKKIAGVCGGIAEYFQIDATLVRVLFVAGCFFYLAGALVYVVILAALPEQPFEPSLEEGSAPKGKSAPSAKRTKRGKKST